MSPLLVVLGFALLAAACGPICGQREPYIYTLVTPDGEYILAMVQSPEPFASRFGYETSPAELELLARYPTSGIYANDESAEMVVPIAQPFPESAVVALYAREEHVVLVARNSFGLTFFRDGREKVEVDGVNEEWGGAPWYASQAAGLACDAWKLDVSLERAATQSLIRVRFGEVASHYYDAESGESVRDVRPPIRARRSISGVEQDILEHLARFKRLARTKDGDALASFLDQHVGDPLLVQCRYFARTDTSDSEDAAEDLDEFHSLRYKSIGLDLAGLQRLRHPMEGQFDLYRVPENRALDHFCGRGFDSNEFLDSITPAASAHQANRVMRETMSQWEGPSVLMSAQASPSSGEHHSGEDGLLLLWSRESGTWKVIAVSFFQFSFLD